MGVSLSQRAEVRAQIIVAAPFFFFKNIFFIFCKFQYEASPAPDATAYHKLTTIPIIQLGLI